MNAVLNYILEANMALVIAFGFYFGFLRRQTRFAIMRTYLLASLVASLLLPLIRITSYQGSVSGLAVGEFIPLYWLPEVVIGGNGADISSNGATVWFYVSVLYLAGLIFSLTIFVRELAGLIRTINRSVKSRHGKLWISQSDENIPTFSFFNFILIGNAQTLTPDERQQIIRHESMHVRQWHSVDILLVNLIKIIFWFNPIIIAYKKTFIQLHEFEADARSVENSDVNKYCNLLARVALQSADFRLANQFTNSLTVKRIEMMRTIKQNISHWRFAAACMALPFLFFFVACHDQVAADLTEITRNSSHALIVPTSVQNRFDDIQQKNPGHKYSLLELNETASQKLEDLKQQYGLPASIQVIRTVDGEPIAETITGNASDIQIAPQTENGRNDRERTFAIFEFTGEARQLAEQAAQDQVFTVVEEQPEFPGGFDAMLTFIRENLRYPKSGREQGLEGTVFASFIVEKDGTVSNINIVRGLSPECDAEVKRMLGISPKWIPGKQSGKDVRVRFVLPVKFTL